MNEPIGEIHYSGEARVRPYRRGTYLGEVHFETMMERALGAHYSFGDGWKGYAVVSIKLYEQPPADAGSS